MRAHEAASDAFATAGFRDEAVKSLRDALAIASDLGANHDARRIGSALRALGVRVGSRSRSPRPRHGWEALTATEREVAALVADGLRNLDIAERLFVSRRTVEAHVARLYEKLEVKNRVALAGVIAGHLTPSASA